MREHDKLLIKEYSDFKAKKLKKIKKIGECKTLGLKLNTFN